MANEITVRTALSIIKRADDTAQTVLIQKNYQGNFKVDMTGAKGPTPGAMTIPVGGYAVPLSQLTRPGWAWIENLGRLSGDPVAGDHVKIGMRDQTANTFMPLLEILPGQKFPLPLSRDIMEQFTDTGVSTSGPTFQLFFKAYPVSQVVSLEAFEA